MISDDRETVTQRGSAPSATPSAPEEGRFPAGTVLAGRYRVLGMLGRGGMGEVYKAFDLILNQVVALKFLNPSQVSEAALARFRNEVRIARQVSHPNVCRVYDLGMVEGLHFLSMEFIDGEDLSSLLRRIGRLPQDKAMEFTRKICAGLGAAHERGVLHRDLKPANIMIDGRGQPRITDFGLAALAAEIPLSDLRSGTPAYMSPEQKAGKEVTTRSDLYSLGLVLHEMFTGKARRDSQSAPSEIVKDLDPAIERVILRCLEEEPRRRPSTALAVALGMPGADPIAAALAAGETPSPEMVAASTEREGYQPRTAVLWFLVCAVSLGGGLFLSERLGFLAQAPMPKPPDALAEISQQVLKRVGYTEAPADSVYGFSCCDSEVETEIRALPSDKQSAVIASHRPALIHFWYRQHRGAFAAGDGQYGRPTEMSPSNSEPGMIRVDLDAMGRLLRLEVQPWETNAAAGDVNWSNLFEAAGLDMAAFAVVKDDVVPPMAVDAQIAWRGSYSQAWGQPVTVHAASWRGRPVFFEVQKIEAASPVLLPMPPMAGFLASCVIFVLFGWRNWRSGRVDRRGAGLVMGWVAVLTLAAGYGLAFTFAGAFFVGAVYVTVEPYMRRFWPDSLISWTRVTRGHFRDTLVASHVLVGLGLGMAVGYLWRTNALLAWGGSGVPLAGAEVQRLAFQGAGVSLILSMIRAPFGAFIYLLTFVGFRVAVKRLWLADTLAAVVFNMLIVGASLDGTLLRVKILQGLVMTIVSFAWITVLRRCGLLSFLLLWAAFQITVNTAVFTSGWVARDTLPAHLAPMAVAMWAVWVVLTAGKGKREAEA